MLKIFLKGKKILLRYLRTARNLDKFYHLQWYSRKILNNCIYQMLWISIAKLLWRFTYYLYTLLDFPLTPQFKASALIFWGFLRNTSDTIKKKTSKFHTININDAFTAHQLCQGCRLRRWYSPPQLELHTRWKHSHPLHWKSRLWKKRSKSRIGSAQHWRLWCQFPNMTIFMLKHGTLTHMQSGGAREVF